MKINDEQIESEEILLKTSRQIVSKVTTRNKYTNELYSAIRIRYTDSKVYSTCIQVQYFERDYNSDPKKYLDKFHDDLIAGFKCDIIHRERQLEKVKRRIELAESDKKLYK